MRFETPAFGGGFFLRSLRREQRAGCRHNQRPPQLSTANIVIISPPPGGGDVHWLSPDWGMCKTTPMEMVVTEKGDR